MSIYLVEENVAPDLSCNEELCLLYLFSASVRESMLKIRKNIADEEKLGISHELIRILPLLLQKYRGKYSGNSKHLIEILSLVDCINFQTYADLRKIPVCNFMLNF